MKNLPIISLFKVILAVLILLISAREVFSFQSTFVPVNESRLWIEGSSNVNQFECRAEEYQGEATVPETESENEPSVYPAAQANETLFLKLDIRVDSIECGKSKMNQDLQKALKAEQYPEISFLFQEANILDEPNSNQNEDIFILQVKGLLTVAGTTKEISFKTEAYFINESRVRATGGTKINMTDFGVEPPTALMGLIRANEELTVNFDLIATPKNI